MKEDNIPVVIYGTGKFGKAVAKFVAENNISILCFLDREEYWYYGKSIKICGNTIECLTKEELMRKKKYIIDSILEMKDYLGELPEKVFAFEPDKNNAAKIFKNFSDNEKKRISVINAGLYCCDGTMNFLASGTLGSEISENAEDTIMVQALDMHSEFKSATIIKMDIEGCELEALRGGGEFI